jgi:hypothetical protein
MVYLFQIYAKEIGNFKARSNIITGLGKSGKFLLKSHRSAKSLAHITCVNETLGSFVNASLGHAKNELN